MKIFVLCSAFNFEVRQKSVKYFFVENNVFYEISYVHHLLIFKIEGAVPLQRIINAFFIFFQKILYLFITINFQNGPPRSDNTVHSAFPHAR